MEARGEGPAISEVKKRLRARFPAAEPEVIDLLITRLHHQFDGRPIRDFVPVLVERQAADHLTTTARRDARDTR